MKASELMIGDWVEWQGKFHTVKDAIDFTFVKEFRPISLTPEILEKNGSVPYEEDKEDFHDENCVFLKQSLGGYGVCIDKNRTVTGLFHYVHELQHALRLCGLETLADNFKI